MEYHAMAKLTKFLKNNGLKLLIALVVWAIAIGVVSLVVVQAENKAPWTPWQRPYRMLPYVREASLSQNPVDLSLSYIGASQAYGIISGSETRNWVNNTYSELGPHTPPNNANGASGSYDEFGTLHAAWGGRATNGSFHLFYNRVVARSNNVGQPRDLTLELSGDPNRYQLGAELAYSRQQKKVFILFVNRDGTSDTAPSPVLFTESADQGTSWSQPIELGKLEGYAPAPPNIVVDSQGQPHIFYGWMDGQNPTSKYYHRYRKADGSWTGAEDITENSPNVINRPKVALAPDGDLWVAWTAGTISASRRESQSGQWQLYPDISGDEYTGWPGITVGANGRVWVSWVHRVGDNMADWQTEFTIFDGKSWIPAQVGFVFGDKTVTKDLAWSRINCLNSLYAKGLIYLVLCVATDDPSGAWQQFSLFMSTVPEGWLPGQVITPTPTPTDNITPSPTPGGPTPSPTIVPAGADSFEPDNTLTQALARGHYLSADQPETHTLTRGDLDILPILIEEGKSYTLNLSANGFQPKLSLYLEQGNNLWQWIGAANECNGNRANLCYPISSGSSRRYYAQISSYNDIKEPTPVPYIVTLSRNQTNFGSPTPMTTEVANSSPTPTVAVSSSPSPLPGSTSNSYTPLPGQQTNLPAGQSLTSVAVSPIATATETNPTGNSGGNSGKSSPAPKVENSTQSGSGESGGKSTTQAANRPVEPTVTPDLQAIAALTPLKVVVPVQPGRGIGPELVLPTATPSPIPSPTPTPKPTATPNPTRVANSAGGVIGPANPGGTTNPKATPTPSTTKAAPKTVAPSFGPLFWPILGGIFILWGGLNLYSRRQLRQKLARTLKAQKPAPTVG